MTAGEALSIRVGLDGVDSVVRGLGSIERAIDSAAGRSRLLAGVGAGLAAAGIGLAASSNKAYENFEKMRRVFTTFAGNAEGNKLASWLSEYSTQANTSTEALQNAASRWLSATNDLQRVRPLVTGLERLGGILNRDEIERVALALGQIRNSGTLKAQDLNQLIQANVPLNLVAKNLGVSNIRSALGQDSVKVIDAVIKTFNDLPKQVPLGTQALNNALEGLQRSLIPTGQLIQRALVPVAAGAAALADGFQKVNAATGGGAGLIVITGLLAGGFWLIYRSIFSPVRALKRLTDASNSAASALERLARSGNGSGRGGGRGPGGGGGGIGGGGSYGGGNGPTAGGGPALPGNGPNVPALPGAAVGLGSAGIGVTLFRASAHAIIGAALIALGNFVTIETVRAIRRRQGLNPGPNSSEMIGNFVQKGHFFGWRWDQTKRTAAPAPAVIPSSERPQRRHSPEQIILAMQASALGG